MKNTILFLFLLLIPFKIFSQGNYCSRNSELTVKEETYLSNIIKSSSNLGELFSSINEKLKTHYYELLEKNSRYLKETYSNLDCLIKPGFCGVLSIEIFGYFQDGVFDNFDLSNTYIKDMSAYKEQVLKGKQLKDYLKLNYTNKNQNVLDFLIKNPSIYTNEYITLKVKSHLHNSGEHGIILITYTENNDNNLIVHMFNVLNFNNDIYYSNDTYLTNDINSILSPRNSNIDRLNSVFIVYIQ